MKTIFIKIIKKTKAIQLCVVGIMLFFTNCEKESMSKSIDHNSFLVENGNNNIIKTGKFNDFKELKSFVEKIKKEKESLLHRTSIEDNNDFTILEDRDIYIYDDGLTTSYTMAIQKENQSTFSFSNLVVKFSNNDTTTAFILNYIPSQDYLNNYVNDPQIPFQGEVNYESIDYDGSLDDLNARYTCNSITVTYCNYGGEVHAAGENCTPSFMFDVTYDICYDSNNGQPLNESIDPPAGPNNGGGGSNSNPTIPLPTDTCEDSNTGNIGLIGGNGNCYSSEMLALSDELEEILDGIDYEYDSSLTDYEVISFNTVDEFEEFHDSIFDDVETEDSETSNDDGISKTKTFDHIFDIGMFSYTIKVEVETTIPSANSCDCMVVEDVTTILIGNTTLVEWEQLGNHTTEVSSDGSELTVYTRGTMTVGVKIDGYPFRTTYLVTFVQVFDYSTGYVIEYYLIKE